jgi:hypothetical protein
MKDALATFFANAVAVIVAVAVCPIFYFSPLIFF